MIYKHEGPATARQMLEIGYRLNESVANDAITAGR